MDHPRSRGVYVLAVERHDLAHGSSPLARGLRHTVTVRPDGVRIIPARAGFTYIDKWGEIKAKDHPRSRGVYLRMPRSIIIASGSSPLARGLRAQPAHDGAPARIIPARAGFTRPPRRRGGRRWDHPRSRGVYLPSLGQYDSSPGSSPLARGLPISDGTRAALLRIIPARAGFTDRRSQGQEL